MSAQLAKILIRTTTITSAMASAIAICVVVFTTDITPFFGLIGAPALILGTIIAFERLDTLLVRIVQDAPKSIVPKQSRVAQPKVAQMKQVAPPYPISAIEKWDMDHQRCC